MTFAEFLKSKTETADIGGLIGDLGLNDVPGFVYAGCFYIEKTERGFEMPVYGDLFEGKLDQLERKLYDFAVEEGCFPSVLVLARAE